MLDAKFAMDLIGNLGSVGLVFWMVVRLTNHTIPRLADQFITSNKEQREDFKQILAQQRADMLEALHRQEQFRRDEIIMLVSSTNSIRSEIKDAMK